MVFGKINQQITRMLYYNVTIIAFTLLCSVFHELHVRLFSHLPCSILDKIKYRSCGTLWLNYIPFAYIYAYNLKIVYLLHKGINELHTLVCAYIYIYIVNYIKG